MQQPGSNHHGENFEVHELLQNIPEFVFEYISTGRRSGYYTYASDSCEDVYGCKPSDLLNDSSLSYKSIHEEDRESFKNGFNNAVDREELFNWQGRLMTPDFRLKWVNIKARPIRKDGSTIRWYGVVQDITSFKTLERELKFAKEKAEREAKAREDFLATMSHDIRTPLGGIMGMTDLLMMEASEEQKEYLNLLKYASNNLSSLVNNILDYSRLNSGQMINNPSKMSMSMFLSSIFQIHQFKAREQGNLLVFDIDPELPDYLLADEMILSQILNNLLNNALKFTRQGRVTLKLRLIENADNQVLLGFEVKDTGVGMSKADLNKIFEKFKQVGSASDRTQGTGLGLTITKQLIELLDGDLQVQSELNEGTKFSFKLQLETLDNSLELPIKNQSVCL